MAENAHYEIVQENIKNLMQMLKSQNWRMRQVLHINKAIIELENILKEE